MIFCFVISIDGTLGFQLECNTTETIVLFQCNKNAQWDTYDPDVSHFVGSFIADIVNKCLVKVSLSPTSYFFFLIVPDDIGLQWSLYCSEKRQSIHIFVSLGIMTFKHSQSML